MTTKQQTLYENDEMLLKLNKRDLLILTTIIIININRALTYGLKNYNHEKTD